MVIFEEKAGVISKENKERLEKSGNVEFVDGILIVITAQFHQMLYECWEKTPTVFAIKEELQKGGIDPLLVGEQYATALACDFETYGDPSADLSVEGLKPVPSRIRRNDIALLSTGKCFITGRGFQWKEEFRKELERAFPEITIEESLMEAGISPQVVGNVRINSLRHRFRKNAQRKQDAQESSGKRAAQDGPGEAVSPDDAYRYLNHPYVEDVTGTSRLYMKEAFYNETYYLGHMPVKDILGIYGIDSGVLGRSCVLQIEEKLRGWEPTPVRWCGEWTDEVCRIQTARLGALTRYTEECFSEIRKAARTLMPTGKKELCRQLSGYPTSRDYPCGYSFLEILGRSGISKTVYYKAMNGKSYGLAQKRREERDRQDLEKLLTVVEYKGFEKGIRQIYMMMPDITGERFAISKIRRLLRQNGIKTKVRGKNPARRRMGDYMERNRKPNLLKRKFRLHRPGEVRLTDVTYLYYGEGEEKQKAYGSSCIDPVTGKLLVFHVSKSNDLELALGTLERLSDYPAVEGALFHSDQGILYFSDEFQKKVAEMGMVQSMSKRGNCWDNAPQESFFGHFKDECRYETCKNFEELQAMVEEYTWYYNNERHLWDRKRMTPVQYEEYLLSLDEEEYNTYMESEMKKYDKMKEKAEKQARLRAGTLGV